jgi:WD40 repeat protein
VLETKLAGNNARPVRRLVHWFLVSGCLGVLVTLANVAVVLAVNPAILPMLWPSSIAGPAPAGGSVLSDIIRQQRDEGLTIVFYDHTLSAVSFNHRSKLKSVNLPFLIPAMTGAVSPDGMQVAGYVLNGPGRVILGIVRFDGSDPREYQGIAPLDFCWSHDNQSIALTNASGHRPSDMEVVNVSTKDTRLIQANVEKRWHFNSQCWSPDDKQIVFENGGSTQVYDIASGKIRDLVKGLNPTWSPDGEWIAFHRSETYYAIHPSGEGQKKLFHKTRAVSALFWSPDSRFVAYVHQDFFALDVEFYHLMVRRLDDGSEDWVANGVSCCINYEWVKNPELLKQLKTAR